MRAIRHVCPEEMRGNDAKMSSMYEPCSSAKDVVSHSNTSTLPSCQLMYCPCFNTYIAVSYMCTEGICIVSIVIIIAMLNPNKSMIMISTHTANSRTCDFNETADLKLLPANHHRLLPIIAIL